MYIIILDTKQKKERREKVREITQGEWEDLIERLNILESHSKVNSDEFANIHNKLTELEERVGHSELTIERLEHSEDKENLDSIDKCKKYIKVRINDKECRTPDKPCKTCKWCEESIVEDICKNEKSKYWMLMVNKEEYTCENWEEKLTCGNCEYKENAGLEKCANKNSNLYTYFVVKDTPACNKWEEKEAKNWIVHRTLRKKNKEIYIGTKNAEFTQHYLCAFKEKIPTTYEREYSFKYDFYNAVMIRDELNKARVGKQFLWVVSKV